MFFEFNQNNSGGGFDFNKERGITHIVLIEADNEVEAVNKAEDVGIYFNGIEDGIDCDCCGDRWNMPWDSTNEPLVYGQSPEKYVANKNNMLWMDEGYEIAVHYKDGRIEWF